MFYVWFGASLMICGVLVAAFRTVNRGRLSGARRARRPNPGTLEPSGRGARLSLVSELPGIILFGIGAVVLMAGAFF